MDEDPHGTGDVRETSSTTTRLVLGHVRAQAGPDAVSAVLRRAGLDLPLAELESDSRWVSYDARIRLFESVTEVLGDRHALFAVGASVLSQQVTPSLALLLRALGSPAQVFRQLPRAVAKFSTTSTMQVLEVGATHATISYVLHDGYAHSRLDCEYAQGLFSCVPELFGLPPARIVHEECESAGAAACIYHVTWARYSRWGRRARRLRATDVEITALRDQLAALQSASSDLVSSDDVGQVLQRITDRAVSAVLAQGYLLAVQRPDGTPLVHSSGVDPARARALAEVLLAGGDLGPSAVVVDVTSTRRTHGRLAALYGPGQRGVADEHRLLAAYARHAAAALDMLTALDGSRRGERRAATLLALAHQLAGVQNRERIAGLIAEALPQVVGCASAGVYLWDGSQGTLRGAACAGLSDERRAQMLVATLQPAQVPELGHMLAAQEPVELLAGQVSPVLAQLMTVLDLARTLVVPLLAGGELHGVVTASRPVGQAPGAEEEDLLLRLQGVADQAASALHAAELLSTVRHQALHDDLTGLPNRVLLADRLEQALVASGPGGCVGVLFCDLDRFKLVNDALGHTAGDELLRQAACRLHDAVGPGHSVGRLSGDEFAALLPGIADLGAAAAVGRRVTECFEHPFHIEGQELRISVSVGAVVHTGEGGRGDRLLRGADAAMYQAKQSGRNQVRVLTEVPVTSPAGPTPARELAAALEQDQLRLHFQPVVDTVSGTALAVEALIRWQHPRLGLLRPASFLPLAAESGLGVQLDRWVLVTACRALAAARRDGSTLDHVAVNLSGRTLQEPGLVGWVREALRESGLAPAGLVVEVVESRSLVDLPRLAERLAALRQLGVRVALDDFGTGYSTLTWLQRLPVDILKVDRSFLEAIDTDPASRGLVRGLVQLARELSLDLVAEGVETAAQLAALQDAGCRQAQGFLLGRPAPELPRPATQPDGPCLTTNAQARPYAPP